MKFEWNSCIYHPAILFFYHWLQIPESRMKGIPSGYLIFFYHWLQIPESHMKRYISQVLGVIIALLEDPEESVQLTAVQCLLKVNSLSSRYLYIFFTIIV